MSLLSSTQPGSVSVMSTSPTVKVLVASSLSWKNARVPPTAMAAMATVAHMATIFFFISCFLSLCVYRQSRVLPAVTPYSAGRRPLIGSSHPTSSRSCCFL